MREPIITCDSDDDEKPMLLKSSHELGFLSIPRYQTQYRKV